MTGPLYQSGLVVSIQAMSDKMRNDIEASQLELTKPAILPAARRLHWYLFLLGGLLLITWAWATGWLAPITASDVGQSRTNVVLPAPGDSSQIRQTFVPTRDGLAELELLFARSEQNTDNSWIQIQLLDESGNLVADRKLDTKDLTHNQAFTLRFPTQSDSAGQRYLLLVSGSTNNNVSVWGYDLDAYTDGELEMIGAQIAAQDLRFNTRYRLTPTFALASLVEMVLSTAGLILLALALIFMPGCLLLLAASRWTKNWDPVAWLGVALATGAAIWPLLWLWLSLIGGRWTSPLLWLVLILGWSGVLALFLAGRSQGRFISFRKRPHDDQPGRPTWNRTFGLRWQHGILLLILLLGLAVRLLAVRDLGFPPWVDSSRHALITAVMAKSGQVVQDYAPLLPVDRFPYHYGFHSLSAGLFMMTGKPLPQLLLVLGQLLNALVPLSIYAGAYLLSRRKGVGLLAAFLVALPFFFPAYYATWGRMTQLTALLILPVLLALSWLLVRGARGWRYIWWLIGILAAGLFMVHLRVFLLYLIFVGIVWLFSAARHSRWLAAASGLALLLVGPRLVPLIRDIERLPVLISSPTGYNDFPLGYLTVGWERAFLFLGGIAIILALMAGLRRRNWAWLPLLLGAWVGVTGIFLSGSRLGLPESWVINLNSTYITFFVPLSLILAIVADRTWRWLDHRLGLLNSVAWFAAGAAVAAALLFGLHQQIAILNPQTILAEKQDLEGLLWLDQNLPQRAKIAVSSWKWLGNIWAGSDGGAWIVPLTGRMTSTPPADYTYNHNLNQSVINFNEKAVNIKDWADPEAADWLRSQSITHIYVGARGGFFDPAALAANPDLRKLYGSDGIFVFAVN
jgi:hypothetical protein